jgi:hypothetical protein
MNRLLVALMAKLFLGFGLYDIDELQQACIYARRIQDDAPRYGQKQTLAQKTKKSRQASSRTRTQPHTKQYM